MGWDEKPTINCWGFKYMDSHFDTDGGQMTDVNIRIDRSRQRFGIWEDTRHLTKLVTGHYSCTPKSEDEVVLVQVECMSYVRY